MAEGSSGQSGRHRGRRGVVKSSSNRDEYERLLAGGWSSLSLERYALARYGEDIPASTFRRHRDWMAAQGRQIADHVKVKGWDPERILDVVTSRQELVMMQQDRLRMQIEGELKSGRLRSGTAAEMRLLDHLLRQLKGDFQELGIYPKTTPDLEPPPAPPQPANSTAPPVRRLGEVLGPLTSAEVEIQLARIVAAGLPPPKPGQPERSHIILEHDDDPEHVDAR